MKSLTFHIFLPVLLLASLTTALSPSTTPTTTNPNTTLTTSPSNTCNINSVCFAMDMSGSISSAEYTQELNAVIKIATKIADVSTSTSYSAYGFASSAAAIQLPTNKLTSVFVPTLRNYPRFSGGTNIRAGLSACFTPLKDSKGNRVIVLLTDGHDGGTATSVANTIKRSGIKIITVGIGSGVAEDYLMQLASGPRFFVRTAFDTIVNDAIDITRRSCSVVSESTAPVVSPAAKVTPNTVDECEKAYQNCGFTFRGTSSVPTIKLGRPDKALSSKIVSRVAGERVGIVNLNGISAEFVNADGSTSEISSVGSPRFVPTQFKPFRIRNKAYASGIGHQKFHGNQKRMARGRCVRVFLTHYQVLGGGKVTYVKKNLVVKRADNKCVVFRADQ